MKTKIKNCEHYVSYAALIFATILPQFANAQTVGSAMIMLQNASNAPAGSQTQAKAISADGSIIAGGNTDSTFAMIWRNGTPEAIDTSASLNGFRFESISGDGLTLTGRDKNRKPSYWTASEGLVSFQNPIANQQTYGFARVDNNGTYFTVNSGQTPNAISPFMAWRWSRTGGYENLGSFGANWDMYAEGISGDGQKVAINGLNREVFSPNDGFQQVAAYWTQSTGLTRLLDLSSAPLNGTELTYSRTFGISRDGSTIVGASRGSDGLVQAAYWRGGNVFGLGFLPGANVPSDRGAFAIGATQALAANLDGSIIVGKSIGANNDLAWRWTASSGMQDLNIFAANAGINLNGAILTEAVGLSDNGQFITGNAIYGSQHFGYVLQIAQITQSRLIVNMRLGGVTLSTIINQTFNTQIDATLNGTSVFTRSFNDAINSSNGTNVLNDARAALTGTNGLRRLNISAPILVSSNTIVLGTTYNTIDVLTGTITNTATVNTFGPATVATGDLGVCATAASNNQNPTGCSLTGTLVNVDNGVLNSNVFTNTINTITPTTTPTINQLISAKWKIEAIAGNQFGTVHALVAPVGFSRSDRLFTQLFSNNGMINSSKNIVKGDNGITLFGSYLGNSSKIDANINVGTAQIKGNSNSLVFGAKKQISPNAWLGAAIDHGSSEFDVKDSAFPENLSLKQTLFAISGGMQNGKILINGGLSFGLGNAETNISTPTGYANATRDFNSLSAGTQISFSLLEGKNIDLALIGGAIANSAKLDNFTESGGSNPIIGLEKDVNANKIYAGIGGEARSKIGQLQFYARGAQNSGDYRGIADLKLALDQTGATLQAFAPQTGKTATEIGLYLSKDLNPKTRISIGYDGSFTKHSQTNNAKIGINLKW